MTAGSDIADAVVIGGGFYGSAIAIYLAKQRGFARVHLLEREASLLSRASYHNQARVHNGYHYPRSFTTAYRSRINLPRFVRDWPQAVSKDFLKLYAIARRNSKVTGKQFERFCREIGASLQPAPSNVRALFETHLIEDVFVVEEYAFDATKLREWAHRELSDSTVKLHLHTRAAAISRQAGGPHLQVTTEAKAPTGERSQTITSRYVFNCTYSGLNQLQGDFPGSQSPLKHELTEMALIKVPPALEHVGVTVMDGPFFSIMPFPARGFHTLSHVRYTPHLSWEDCQGRDPYLKLANHARSTRFDRMIRDTARYMPMMAQARHIDSLYEVKTVLTKNEGDDGRPILFEKHATLSNCYSILGGKIDNIYDILEKLDAESLA